MSVPSVLLHDQQIEWADCVLDCGGCFLKQGLTHALDLDHDGGRATRIGHVLNAQDPYEVSPKAHRLRISQRVLSRSRDGLQCGLGHARHLGST